MDKYIRVKNCNCISDATIEIVEKSLNIKYGSNGTGKSTIVHALLKIYTSLYPEDRIGLVAPTGRAAKRLTELTGIEACTIHR